MEEENTMDETVAKYTLEELLEAGVYVPVGEDENGDTLYELDFEKAKEVAPEIYHAELNALDAAILEAVDKGYMELDFGIGDDGEPYVEYIVTDKVDDEEE